MSRTRSDREEWQAFKVGAANVRVKVDPRSDGTEPFSFTAVSPTGDTHLHSVSRRSPVRKLINVWTSRNVALRTTRPRLIASILQQLEQGHSLDSALLV